MIKRGFGLLAVAALAAGAWVGLAAREEKAKLPDDLARVPGQARAVVSVRVADLWDHELTRQVRKAMGKQEKELLAAIAHGGFAPEQIERVTVAMRSLKSNSPLVFLRSTKKIDAKATLEKLVRSGKEETFGGQKVLSGSNMSGFVTADGHTLIFGMRDGVQSLLEDKPVRPAGPLAAALEKAAAKHMIAAFGDPSELADMADKLPATLAAGKPLLRAKGGVMWADVGYSSKAGGELWFADEKDAERGRKVVDAGRKVASVFLAGLGDSYAKTSKPIAALMDTLANALDRSTLDRSGDVVKVAVEVKLEKATTAGLIKEVMAKMVIRSAQAQSANNLKQIGLAMHNYHDSMGTFPPRAVYDKDGKPLLSWRVLILPYVEEDALYRQFKLDEPWDSPHNKKLLARVPRVYAAPNARPSAAGGTFYQAFAGKGSIFEGKRGTRITDITDGTSNTIMVVEAEKDVPWSKPDDLPFDPDGKLPKLGGVFEEGFNALFGDGSVRFMARKLKPDTLKKYITRNGGEVIGRDE